MSKADIICPKCMYFKKGERESGVCRYYPDRPRPFRASPRTHPQWCPLCGINRARCEAAEEAEWEAVGRELQLIKDGHPGFSFQWSRNYFEDGHEKHWYMIVLIERKRPEEDHA